MPSCFYCCFGPRRRPYISGYPLECMCEWTGRRGRAHWSFNDVSPPRCPTLPYEGITGLSRSTRPHFLQWFFFVPYPNSMWEHEHLGFYLYNCLSFGRTRGLFLSFFFFYTLHGRDIAHFYSRPPPSSGRSHTAGGRFTSPEETVAETRTSILGCQIDVIKYKNILLRAGPVGEGRRGDQRVDSAS